MIVSLITVLTEICVQEEGIWICEALQVCHNNNLHQCSSWVLSLILISACRTVHSHVTTAPGPHVAAKKRTQTLASRRTGALALGRGAGAMLQWMMKTAIRWIHSDI